MAEAEDRLVRIYSVGDVAEATFLGSLLQERGISAYAREATNSALRLAGIMGAAGGVFGYNLMVLESDAEEHAEEIAAAINDFEAAMR